MNAMYSETVGQMMMGHNAAHLSNEFYKLIKAVGETYSKQEENAIMEKEARRLKEKLKSNASLPRNRLKEFVIRCMYLEMLGHDAQFGHMKAVELVASSKIAEKRTGYLACGIFLSPDNVFRVMLVNQIQRDLASSNFLDVSAALQAAACLATPEMVPPLVGLVVRLARHDNTDVRKKALGTLHSFTMLDYSIVMESADAFRRALCDAQPSVMASALPPLEYLIKKDANFFKDLVPSLVSIVKQIAEHRLPKEFDYHRVPAPWITMHLVRILSLLGKSDKEASEGMYEVLVEVMRRSDMGISASNAVLYECVKCATTIYPNDALLEKSASFVNRLLTAEASLNSKYIGIKGLNSIVRIRPAIGNRYQLAVIDCLEHSDSTLRIQALSLLCRMANAQNVESIMETLIEALRIEADQFRKKELCHDAIGVAEKLAPNDEWYINTMTDIFIICGDLVQESVMQDLLSILAEASADNNEDLCVRAVESFLVVLEESNEQGTLLPDIVIQAIAWTLGEYGSWTETRTGAEVMQELVNYAELLKTQPNHQQTVCMLVTAMMKLTATTGGCDGRILEFIEAGTMSEDANLQDRCLLMLALIKQPEIYVQVVPVDASSEDIEVDESLAFLNNFVQASLEAGSSRYSPPDLDSDDVKENESVTLSFTPYSKPEVFAKPPPLLKPTETDPAAQQAQGVAAASLSREAAKPTLQKKHGPWGRPNPVEVAVSRVPASSASVVAPVAVSSEAVEQDNRPQPADVWESQGTSSETDMEMQEQREKELRAAALFGGGSSSGATQGRRRRQAPAKRNGAPSKSAAVPERPSTPLAFDSAPVAQEPDSAPAVEPAATMQDLLNEPVPDSDIPLLIDLLGIEDKASEGVSPETQAPKTGEVEDPFAGL